MPAFGPEVFTPTTSATDDDLANLTGSVPGKLRSLLTAPFGGVRVIAMFYVGVFTNITRIRLVRDRQELTTYAAAFSATFDPEKAIYLGSGFTSTFQILATTSGAATMTLYFTYEDVFGSPRGRARGRR